MRTAILSKCGLFRYSLTRIWDSNLPILVFVMLNPSTADAARDDATIRKCIGFATRLDFGGIKVVNLFAFRARDPRDLERSGYQIGPANEDCIRTACVDSDGNLRTVICAWGSNARGLKQADDVLAMLREMGVRPHALDLTHDGIPRHPLMLPYTCKPKELTWPPKTTSRSILPLRRATAQSASPTSTSRNRSS